MYIKVVDIGGSWPSPHGKYAKITRESGYEQFTVCQVIGGEIDIVMLMLGLKLSTGILCFQVMFGR